MALIHVLPPEVASKIAAGEVVERPASVVKELVDNAIDARAERITVEIEDGGRKLIRVTDDGCGMSREDARLAVERHATSKITTAEDLDAIATLGFRGEALASIAAVTRFEILTRREEDIEGTRLRMDGTVKPKVEPAGAPAGSSISASDLYFNTPARLKFLKTTATELAHVADMVNRAALPNHEIHFTLRHNGKPVLDYPRVRTRQERLFAFWGKEVWSNMRPLPDLGTGTAGGIRIEGYASLPVESRNRADQVYFFVNDRYVQNRTMLSAVMEGYRRLLHPGRYPAAALFLYLDPENFDINVHPKKQEIKFADEQKIWRAVYSSVREGLARMEQEGGRLFAPPPGSSKPMAQAPASPEASDRSSGPVASGLSSCQAEQIRLAVDRFFEKRQAESPSLNQPRAEAKPVQSPEPAGQTEVKSCISFIGDDSPLPAAQQAPSEPPSAGRVEPDRSAHLFAPDDKPVPRAQILDTYLICEQKGRMVIVDQHAAAERIRYEQLKHQLRGGGPRQQTLMFPEMIEVPPGEVPLMEENLPLFRGLGFEIEYFGQNSFSVSAMPALYPLDVCERLVLDLLKDLTQAGGHSAMDEIQERLLVRMACHGSIRGGDRLSPEAMQDLVDRLFESQHPYTCPHGRPTLIALSDADLERMFKRSGF